MYTESRTERLSRKDNSLQGNLHQGMMIGTMAFAAVAVIVFLFFKNENARDYNYNTPKVILAGDSIFAYFQDERSVASLLSEKLSEDVLDVSMGGTCMAYCDRDGRLDDTRDCMSMAALTQAKVNDDFRYQDNSPLTIGSMDYYEDRLEDIKKTDYSKGEILIIEHLLNDYQNGVPVETGSDIYDEYTYEGALRSVVSTLKKEYPNLRIILASPILTWYPSTVTVTDEDGATHEEQDFDHMITAHESDFGGGTIDKYKDVQERIADEMGVEYIDLSLSFDNTAYENRYTYSDEGIHPSEYGSQLIAEYIFRYLSGEEVSK